MFQILAAEIIEPEHDKDTTECIIRLVDAVRALPGLRDAKAIFAFEANSIMIAETLHCLLRKEGDRIQNWHLLHLQAQYSHKRRIDDSPANEFAEMRPGVTLSEKNKPLVMDMITQLLDDGRVMRHQDMVTYATRRKNYEDSLLYASPLPRPLWCAENPEFRGQVSPPLQVRVRQ